MKCICEWTSRLFAGVGVVMLALSLVAAPQTEVKAAAVPAPTCTSNCTGCNLIPPCGTPGGTCDPSNGATCSACGCVEYDDPLQGKICKRSCAILT